MSPLPPPPRLAAPPGAATAPSTKKFSTTSGRQSGAQRVLLYGPGGIGKSSLAALAPRPVFVDVEEGTRELDVERVSGIENFNDLRAAVLDLESSAFESVVVDTVTRVEEMSIAHTLATVRHEKGHAVTRMEDYGFSKGLAHNFDTFAPLLQDLDRLVRAGKHVILIAHVCTTPVPNPTGEDWIRYEPRLQTTAKGLNSIRDRVFEWADHVLFIGYDVAVNRDGKGMGAGTRSIFPHEMPTHRAKTRRNVDPLPFVKGDGAIWNLILGGKQ